MAPAQHAMKGDAMLYLARFFYVVPPMPLLMIGTFVVTIAVAGVIVVINPTQSAGVLTPILLLQTFACSSGFDVPARRGHYDLLLTHGGTRVGIAAAHWVASSLPGGLAWAIVAMIQAVILRGQARPYLFDGGTIVAFVLVSTIPWAATIRLPRFSGAIGWLLVAAIMTSATPWMFSADVSSPVTGSTEWMQMATAVLVYPPLLVGRELAGADRLIVLPALLLAIIAVLFGIWSVGRRDIPLEAAQ
jgi:hypothetical protein